MKTTVAVLVVSLAGCTETISLTGQLGRDSDSAWRATALIGAGFAVPDLDDDDEERKVHSFELITGLDPNGALYGTGYGRDYLGDKDDPVGWGYDVRLYTAGDDQIASVENPPERAVAELGLGLTHAFVGRPPESGHSWLGGRSPRALLVHLGPFVQVSRRGAGDPAAPPTSPATRTQVGGELTLRYLARSK